jgi:photosystem II stability/assembly factor-like uncharacterized protein
MRANGEGWLAARSTSTALLRLYRTTDGGKHWTLDALPHTVGRASVVPLAAPEFFVASRQWLLVVAVETDGLGDTCEVLLAPDGHAAWRRSGTCGLRLSPSGGVVSPFFLTAQTGWEQRAGRVFVTLDGGERWTPAGPAPAPGSSSAQPLSLEFVSRQRGWELLTGTSRGAALFQTTDGGMSWRQV